jgi:hypothetical protein
MLRWTVEICWEEGRWDPMEMQQARARVGAGAVQSASGAWQLGRRVFQLFQGAWNACGR